MARVLVALLAALALVGCGGTQIEADEVSGAPPELTVPDGQAAGALEDAGGSSSADKNEDSRTTSTSTDEKDAGDTGSSSGDSGSSGTTNGGAAATPVPQATAAPAPTQAPAAPQDDAQNDTSPPADSGAERFEDFCQQNPGAC